MVDNHSPCLSLPIEPRIGLLVEFQTPRQTKPDERRTAELKVESMSRTRWMNYGDWDVSRIPFRNVCTRPNLSNGQSILDPLKVMAIPIRDEYGLSVRTLDKIFECIQFAVMQVDEFSVLRIDGSVCHLEEFPGKCRRTDSINLRSTKGNHHVPLHSVIEFPLMLIHRDTQAI